MVSSKDATTVKRYSGPNRRGLVGPAMTAAFARAGITTADEVHALGPDAAYRRLLVAGERPHFIAFQALAMGLAGRPWNDCRGAEKAALRLRFDALVSAGRDLPAGIERVARDAGVRIGGELFSDALGEPGAVMAGHDTGTYDGMVRYNMTTILSALEETSEGDRP
jgi:hypothetical protein